MTDVLSDGLWIARGDTWDAAETLARVHGGPDATIYPVMIAPALQLRKWTDVKREAAEASDAYRSAHSRFHSSPSWEHIVREVAFLDWPEAYSILHGFGGVTMDDVGLGPAESWVIF